MSAARTSPPTPHDRAESLLAKADQALADEDSHLLREPAADSGAERAVAYAAVAGVFQLTDLSNRILNVGLDVRRLADTFASYAAPVTDHTENELHAVRAEITRADAKASILLASVAIVAGLLVQKAPVLLHHRWPVALLGVLSTCLAAAATWLLLDVALPRLSGTATTSFLHYADASPGELDLALGQSADRRSELTALSKIARTKFRQLGRAGALLKSSGALLAATAVLAVAF